MSRVVAENISPARDSAPFFHRRQAMELSAPSAAVASPTLGQLLKKVGDVRKEVTGDETPVHRVLEMGGDDAGGEPRSLPFVLSFSNLTYSVKVSRKMSLSHRQTPVPVAGENIFSKTKVLLNEISGEARDGEILAVLGASGFGEIHID
ncbi:hypothetical protein Vadar_004794 [Vaccinium darrowii]|uniref:Uncharacterized protein n=1 Tax=Vaccinium darrowii TaxID=229202 RepID=A0ACB7YJR6_9ERIC|nr:hypothetical protein Vadar_004794 [Vaccinium darrowii]